MIVPIANTLALDYGGISVPGVSFDVGQLKSADIDKIWSIPYQNRLSTVAPKLIGVTTIDGHDFLLVGVRFPEELRMKKWWRLAGRKPTEPNDVIVGSEIARRLGVGGASRTAERSGGGDHGVHAASAVFASKTVRPELVIAGKPFSVAAVLAEKGGQDDQMIFADLGRVQEVTGKPEELSVIEVSALCKDCPIDEIVAQIQHQLPSAKVAAIQQAVRARTATVERLNRFSVSIALIVLVIGGLMITSTLTASVIERTREIGVLRAVGYRRQHIVKMLLLEVSFLSALGGVLGWLAGTGMSAIAVRHFTDTGMSSRPSLALAGASIVMALLLGVVGSIFPARRAAAFDPMEALRQI